MQLDRVLGAQVAIALLILVKFSGAESLNYSLSAKDVRPGLLERS